MAVGRRSPGGRGASLQREALEILQHRLRQEWRHHLVPLRAQEGGARHRRAHDLVVGDGDAHRREVHRRGCGASGWWCW